MSPELLVVSLGIVLEHDRRVVQVAEVVVGRRHGGPGAVCSGVVHTGRQDLLEHGRREQRVCDRWRWRRGAGWGGSEELSAIRKGRRNYMEKTGTIGWLET